MALAALAVSCGGSAVRRAAESIDTAELLTHIQILASDEFGGRAPGTKGERLTVRYLADQLQQLGLRGGIHGAYVQKVPLVRIGTQSTATFRRGARKIALMEGEDYAASRRFVREIKLSTSAMVFVGYGIVAAEYGWNDYKDADVRGETVVMLAGEPAVPDPTDPSKLDERVFRGRAMTRYSLSASKYSTAAENGAGAAILVMDKGRVGQAAPDVDPDVPRGVVSFEIQRPEHAARLSVESRIGPATAQRLFAMNDLDLDALRKAASQRGFKSIVLKTRADLAVKNQLQQLDSNNVLGMLPGSDPKLKDECVVYMAHWDHFGRDPGAKGDGVFNGALDNASGVAGLLELAKAFGRLPASPRRSVLFLATTGEEFGNLGAKYYLDHPACPVQNTVAVINIDGLNPWGRTRDVIVLGAGASTLDGTVRAVAQAQGRVVKPDPQPEEGLFYRSDHIEFAMRGVPALHLDIARDFIGKPTEFGRRRREAYLERDYHQVTDEVKEDWDMSGAVEDLRLLFEVGYRVAQDEGRPAWQPDSEFAPHAGPMLR